MIGEDDRLLALAASIADGAAIDWESAERKASDERERTTIHHLKIVASVSRVHATAPPVAGGARSQPSRTWGHLQLIERIGEGAFGEVHRAWDSALEREVALKLLRPKPPGGEVPGGDATILQEARNLARVRHPNAVTVYGADEREGRIGLWMELVRGRTLESVLREHGSFGAREAAAIGLDMCRALAAVHAAGLIHRDVKAQNVMREEGGRIVLMDFGAGSDVRFPERGEGASPAGTPLYMAPEILEGQRPSVQSDVYSLGVLLYHLVTGGYPIEAYNLVDLLKAHARAKPGMLRDARPDLPLEFVRVVERALARDPAERFASAGEMEHALAAVIGIGRRRWPLWVAAAGAAAAILLLGWFARGLFDGSYRVQASMFRVVEERREPLRHGDSVRVGDSLGIEFQASQSVYVYIVNEDENGERYVLFPLAGFDLQNPLPAREEPHLLPGSTEFWSVTSAGGREQFLIVASPKPDEELEALLAAVPQAERSMPVKLPPFATRGTGAVVPGPATRRAEPLGLIEKAELLASEPEKVSGRWCRRIELKHPGAGGK